MVSTFHGLETARRGMTTQQYALQVTGQNIANANTPGYSRQRVNFTQTAPYPAPAMNRPQIPGQMGTGVEAGSIQRVRESFLDVQFRGENTKSGYWGARSEALEKMEDIMNEPSDNGLSRTLDQFWQSLQDLAVNPEDDGARSVVRQRGVAVAETFNYLSTSLSTIRDDIKSQVDISVKEINSIAEQMNNINQQISEIEPHGYLPNDLYDERDQLVDRLSQLVNVKVTKTSSSTTASPLAEGKYTIEITDASGASLGTLVDGNSSPLSFKSLSADESNGNISGFSLGGTALASTAVGGKLEGMTSAYNNDYPAMLDQLDNLALDFAKAFNDVHSKGWSLNDINSTTGTQTPHDFFALDNPSTPANDQVKIDGTTPAKGAAKLLKVSSEITDDLKNIAAATSKAAGDGSNALNLAGVKDTTNLKSKYEAAIGKMAVDAQQANRMSANSDTLANSVDQRRQSVSGVSLDEEMTNMIQFQHAYNASARMITMVDQMLDKIINGMGMVGR
ncbi:flagellar hook-associated protein FlgK [Fictibacillus terranigra]|uniref:Flagellar hook-associated protein 1 n=1 Tax=Fictibacillus terranigra TaxID=3058424 RepID=A0ABT8E288_9BACL|nr:flagellar hook-associated protein FlgK [Fictibacillus sp. CENA-BCM004]MDN4072024.1 flagellar hook-associated protein FlgK [Fictibacillus sp. CENA-BCM004]